MQQTSLGKLWESIQWIHALIRQITLVTPQGYWEITSRLRHK